MSARLKLLTLAFATLLLVPIVLPNVPLDTPVRVVKRLASRGYNAEQEAVTLLANSDDPEQIIDRAIDAAPDEALTISVDHVRNALTSENGRSIDRSNAFSDDTAALGGADDGLGGNEAPDIESASPVETEGNSATEGTHRAEMPAGRHRTDTNRQIERDTAAQTIDITNDITGQSTGTGVYEDFVAVFRDRYEQLSGTLRSRVNHRPTSAIENMTGGSETGIVGMVSEVRSTKNGHWLVELEDTQGTFPCLITRDDDVADQVDELLLDEVIAVEGQLANDGGILFTNSIHFPDVPMTYKPSTAERHVRAALISDLHVGSDAFVEEAWHRFADWLHTEEAQAVEYLLIGGDMVDGIGVYPGQEDELTIVDIYDQYRRFSELLKEVPAELEIVMIPGNHDAVRLAEPQPAFEDDLRDIMSVHDVRFTGNPSYVTLEGVTILMYHGVSLDEIIAEIPNASYREPHDAMAYLLKKRHVAPQFGDRTRLAPEERDFLIIDEIPDVFHAGHVHTIGTGRYHNVTTINSGCWQRQTPFQRSVDLDPDFGFAPILDLDTLEVRLRKFV